MKISELILQLETIKAKEGDLECLIEITSFDHSVDAFPERVIVKWGSCWIKGEAD